MRVTGLSIYPVKALRAVVVAEATVEARGLSGDRRFMLVDERGRFLSQREEPRLATLEATFEGDALVLSAEGRAPLEVSKAPEGPEISVSIWDDTCTAVDVGDDAARWLEDVLGRAARLVHMPDRSVRPVDEAYAKSPGEMVSFADGYPILVCHTASLAMLDARLAERGEPPTSMDRFRANIVVEGGAPFEEDDWDRIEVGTVTLRVTKPCGRCVVITTDQETGERSPEPLRTLATIRTRDGEALFGVNAVPETLGVIRVGDPVRRLY